MSAVVAPLFTAERDGRRLRAFAAEGSAPSMGWLALADLVSALTEARDDEVELLAGLAGGALGLRLRSVVTADGPLVLVDKPSTFRLLAIIESMEDGPATLAEVRALFEDAIVGALVASVRGLPAVEADRWMAAARRASAAANRAELARMMSGGAGAEIVEGGGRCGP